MAVFPKVLVRSVVAVALLAALIGGGVGIYKHVRWKRFATVEEGVLYRSGQLRGDQLSSAIDRLCLRTVVCFNADSVDEEREICKAKGVDFVYCPMPDSGVGAPERFVEFLRFATDPKQQPLLVHCSAGVARTGAAVALYRVHQNGWTLEDALDELRSFERKGRLEPSLRDHVYSVYRDHVLPMNLGQQPTLAAESPSPSPR